MFFNFLKKNIVRVRIAPSPTGYLHIGTARTALFNWIFAKKHGGEFILRIEDTDLERSDEKYEKDILEGLKWLGLNWDESYKQSERIDIYKKYIEKLLSEKKAFWCPHTKEELEREKREQIANKSVICHRCDARDKFSDKGELIRFKNDVRETESFNDIIRKQISFLPGPMGDFSLVKDLQTPLYNFAAVIDDYEMTISHVIRGEDHIVNTIKQILIQKALGLPRPKYAHLPLILNPDHTKMSKRFSATSVREYKNQGYLPEAMLNFMALLGWHPSEAEKNEKMDINDIINKFEIEKIQKGGAIFDIKKLNWLNSQYIKEKSDEELIEIYKNFIGKNLVDEKTQKLLKFSQDRIEKLSDIQKINGEFSLSEYDKKLLIWKNMEEKTVLENLRRTEETLKCFVDPEFNKKNLEEKLLSLADSLGKPKSNGRPDRGEVLWPLRVALSGKEKSPGPIEILDVIGKKETLCRIEIAIKKIKNSN